MFVALILHRGSISCGYNTYVKNHTTQQVNMYPKRNLKSGATWNNIRIKFNYDFINGDINDPLMCNHEGQIIQYGGDSYLCEQSDILTQERKQAIVGTFENVRMFLQKLLKVMPYNQPIKAENFPDLYNYPEIKTYSNVDLVMTIVARPMNGSPVAAWAQTFMNDEYFRPYLGHVVINPRPVPTEAQSDKSWNNRYFFICLHEIFHALGFAESKYPVFHQYESPEPYDHPTCSFTKYGKTFKFLTTPYAHKFAKKRYGTDTFIGESGNCPAGIELEDHGDSGTAGSHLEERVFNSELMVGITIATENGPFSRLTDASLAILQDTGNYKCDYTMAQPLVWGHPESVNGQPIHNFALGPPITTFPLDYFIDFRQPNNRIQTGGFDFSFHGPPLATQLTNDAKYLQAQQFYNPNNLQTVGYPIFDYLPVVYPDHICPKGQAVINIDKGGREFDNFCGTYTCDGYNSFTINLPNGRGGSTPITCTSSNAGQWGSFPYNSSTANYRCPKPEQFCRSVKLHDAYFTEDPFDLDTKVLEPRPKTSETDNNPNPNAPADQPSVGEEPESSGNDPNIPENQPTQPEDGGGSKNEDPTDDVVVHQTTPASKGGKYNLKLSNTTNNNSSSGMTKPAIITVSVCAIIVVCAIVISGIVFYKMLKSSPDQDEEDSSDVFAI